MQQSTPEPAGSSSSPPLSETPAVRPNATARSALKSCAPAARATSSAARRHRAARRSSRRSSGMAECFGTPRPTKASRPTSTSSICMPAPTSTSCRCCITSCRASAADAFLIGSNYVWGWEVNRVARELVRDWNGRVLGERYLPIGDTDVSRIIAEIRATRPSFVLNNLIGQSSYAFLQAPMRRSAARIRRSCPTDARC